MGFYGKWEINLLGILVPPKPTEPIEPPEPTEPTPAPPEPKPIEPGTGSIPYTHPDDHQLQGHIGDFLDLF